MPRTCRRSDIPKQEAQAMPRIKEAKLLLTLHMTSTNTCCRLLPWLLDPHLHQRPVNCQELQCPARPIDLLSITDFIELHKELDPFKFFPQKHKTY